MTHKDGHRLDIIVGMEYVLQNTIAIGQILNKALAPSDHGGIFIDLNTTIFARNKNLWHPTSEELLLVRKVNSFTTVTPLIPNSAATSN